MKKLTTFALAIFFSGTAMAQAPVFTTVSSMGKQVFAGVKLEQKGHEPETYMMAILGDKMVSEKVSLPKELLHREVVGMVPAKSNQLVVITQRTVEQGDNPQFHTYDVNKKSWKKMGTLACESFAKMKVEANAITLFCVETNKEGKEITTAKKMTMKGITFPSLMDASLPIQKTGEGEWQAELVGEAFEWKELKVGMGKNQKSFTP